MADIRHRVGVDAPQTQVYETLGTVTGLSRWWTRDVRGDAGKELAFYFGGDKPSATMRVARLDPDRRVAWDCVGGPEEWIGTTITFDLYSGPKLGETVVKFTHAGWREPAEFMHHCSTRWGQFLIGLKTGLEDDRWRPYPDMPGASSWN